MKLHEIPGDPALAKKPKRLGRGHGSGQGKTAGKGHKGQQARSGARKRPYFEGGQMPMVRRVPKRGFSNASFGTRHEVVNLTDLNRFADGATVDAQALRAERLVRRPLPIKVLAKGTLETKNLTVQAQAFSATARERIEAAGGKCEIVELPPCRG